MEDLFTVGALISLLTLTVLEVVLGIDNVIFVSSLFTSCAFALAFYFAVVARQQRHERAVDHVRSSATIQG